MMDLLIWAKFKKVKISNMVLSRVLYPDFTSEIRGEDHIKDTDRVRPDLRPLRSA